MPRDYKTGKAIYQEGPKPDTFAPGGPPRSNPLMNAYLELTRQAHQAMRKERTAFQNYKQAERERFIAFKKVVDAEAKINDPKLD